MQRNQLPYAVMIAIGVMGFSQLVDASLGPYEPKGYKDKPMREQDRATSPRLESPSVGSGEAVKRLNSRGVGASAGAGAKGKHHSGAKGVDRSRVQSDLPQVVPE